jgi:FXSXX-COOH protein
MTVEDEDLGTVIPDLRDIPLARLAELGGSVLAHSIDLYRKGLKERGMPLSSFQARI